MLPMAPRRSLFRLIVQTGALLHFEPVCLRYRRLSCAPKLMLGKQVSSAIDSATQRRSRARGTRLQTLRVALGAGVGVGIRFGVGVRVSIGLRVGSGLPGGSEGLSTATKAATTPGLVAWMASR